MQFNPVPSILAARAVSPLAAAAAPAEAPAAAFEAARASEIFVAPSAMPEAMPPEALPSAAAPRPALPGAVPTPPAEAGKALVEASQNLLKHIPGEASGFYLLAVESIIRPTLGQLAMVFGLSFVLLVVVRWLADASRGIMITTILAFLLWMLILDKGFLHVAFPGLLPAPFGLIVAVFYSTLITLLASAGKIR